MPARSIRRPVSNVPRGFPGVRWLHGLLLAAEARNRQARDLARLDDRLLRDVGVSRADAAQEVRRLTQL